MTGRSAMVPGTLAIAGMASAGSALAARSACTGLDLEDCGDAPVFVSEGDLRFDADFGVPNGQWANFGPFNTIHDTVEQPNGVTRGGEESFAYSLSGVRPEEE